MSLLVDDTPGREWASEFEPPSLTKRTTTHHASHQFSGSGIATITV